MNTQFNSGIEYIQYPPPKKLKKAMELQWAKRLINHGIIRLTNVTEYRKIDQTDQSDPYEDIGMKICQGVKCTKDSHNSIYIWCCSSIESYDREILNIDKKYNSILFIDKPPKLFELICRTLKEESYKFLAQAGTVYYDKGGIENQYFWGDNTFQKHAKYAYQKEYRLAIKDLTFSQKTPFIDIELGDCSKFLSLNLKF